MLRSKALGRDAHVTLYLPARFRPTASYPLLVVHDGGDFLQYASMKTVLDNLIHRLDVAETVVAFTHPGERLDEYANSAAHSRFLTKELLPELESSLPLVGQRAGRCLLGLVVRRGRRAVGRLPVARHVRVAGADVRVVRVHRHRQRPRRRAPSSTRS